MTQAIRGAITVENNSISAIKDATVELLTEILNKNKLNTNQISHVFFTMTKDLNAAYPAKFAREELNFENIPMMCYQELDIQNSLKQCLRVMIVLNTAQNEVKHIYLKDAKVLRPDLK